MQPMPLEPAIDVKNLTVTIGSHKILDELSFSIPLGQTTAIIGPNGAGKSVLVKALLRLIPKDSGQVTIFGQPHEQYRKIAPMISYIPQHFHVDPGFPLTVRDLFSLKSPRPLGLNKAQFQRMHELLKMVGLKGLEKAQLYTLSGGQLQRVLLAYGLMDSPRLLLLDEPSAGIDIKGQETIYALLQRIQQESNLTMVLVSHELDVVMQFAQQVLCLNRQLLCAGPPQSVLTNELLKEMYGTTVGHFAHTHSERHA